MEKNETRFRDIALPIKVVANITRLGRLHYSDLYRLSVSSKKRGHLFFGDDVGASLGAVQGVPHSKSKRLQCYNCELRACEVGTAHPLLILRSRLQMLTALTGLYI